LWRSCIHSKSFSFLSKDELASHYHNDAEIRNGAESPEDYEYMLTCKKRVVHFIQRWVMAVRHAVFEDPAAAHFIEVSIESLNTKKQLLKQRGC
jgi:hypothetical protein